jgi:micrococcal nuclease
MYEYNCKILRVIDGDTVDVDIDLGFGIWIHKERIRLHGIDTPESRTRDKIEKIFGFEAKRMVQTWLPVGSNQTLVTTKDKSGKFGRVLGKFIIFDGRNDRVSTLNEWMVENHYAVAYHGQSKESVANEHLKNYQKIVETVDLSQSELDMYINSKS